MNLLSVFVQVVLSSAFVRSAVCVLAAVALAPAADAGARRKPSVLVVHASKYAADVQAKLNSSDQFASVTLFDGRSGTPSLATLLPYDAALVFSDGNFSNTTALGNNLADYVDAGGGVVNMTFSVGSLSPPAGRWNPGYLCMSAGGGLTNGSTTTLNLASVSNQNHPILIGVGSFSGGTNSYRSTRRTW